MTLKNYSEIQLRSCSVSPYRQRLLQTLLTFFPSRRLLEQYIDCNWVQVAKIESNSTLNYRIDDLAKATTYKFRMRTYNTVGTTALYSDYKTIITTTNS